MSIEIIDLLKPKNGGDFPIVEAEDVAVGTVRLPDVLNQKANVSDVATATNNLQGQINQIVISASSEAVVAPEVAAARVGDDGTSYQTLKARLDAENSDLKRVIGIKNVSFSAPNSFYINGAGSETASDDYNCIFVELLKGEKVSLTAKGYSTSICMIALVDGEHQYTKKVMSRSSNIETYAYTAESDCTIALSYDTRQNHTADIIFDSISAISANEDEISNINADLREDMSYADIKSASFANPNAFFINTVGNETASETYNSINVNVSKGEKVTLIASGYSTSIAMIAVYTGTEKYTVKSLSRSSNVETYTYTAESDCTLTLSYDTRSEHKAIISFDASSVTSEIEDEVQSKTNEADFDAYVAYNGDSSRQSVNMYNYRTASADTRLSSSGTSKGRAKSAEGYHLTDYIPVSVGETYFISFNGAASNVNGYCTYDENKTCIDYHTYFGHNNDGTEIEDEGTVYIRVEMQDTLGDYTKCQIQKDEVTPLEPYGELVYYKGNKTVKIKSDGTGDYSSIRTAFETEGENVTYEIYEGTYNIEDYFTSEEIANSSYDSSGSGFVGLRVPNNSKIIGIGNKSAVILHLTLDENEYTYMVRSNIATLNLFGNCHIENITVIAENARTPIHDDFQAAANSTHTILNCDLKNIVVERVTSHGYGLGLRSGLTVNIENCLIYPTMIIHSNTNFAASATVNMKNTNVYSTLSISDAASVSDTEVNLYNTSYGMLVFTDSNDNNKMHLTVNTSCRNPVVADRIEGSLIIKAPAKESIGKSKLITLNIDSHDIVHAYATQAYDKRCVGMSMSAVEAGGETYIFTLDKYVPLSLCGIENANIGDKIAYSNGEFSIDQSGDFGEVIQYGSQMIIALD